MAQPITNQIKPFAGLVSGLQYKGSVTPPSLPAGTKVWGTSKTIGDSQKGVAPLPKPQMSSVSVPSPQSSTPVPTNSPQLPQATPQPIALQNQTPTFNPNFGLQTNTGNAPQGTPMRGLFPDVVSSLSSRSLAGNPQATQATQALSQFDPFKNPVVSDAYKRAQEVNQELAQSKKNQARGEAQQLLAPIPLGDATGRQAATRQQYLTQQQALADELQGQAALYGAGFTGTGQQQAALSSAGGIANTAQSQLLSGLASAGSLAQPSGNFPFVFDPTTGSFTTSGGGTSGFNPTTAAQQYAKDVISGVRSYADAVSAMSLYGAAAQQFLDQAIQQQSPNFNFAQARSLGDIQGTIGPQYNFAQQALSNVENALQKLGGLQTTNVPLWNQFANFASLQSGIGGDSTREFVSAVQSLRNAYAAILASARGGTPSDFSAQAIAEIPDIPTPNDLAAIRHNLETLGQARVGIYGQPGGQSTSYAQPTGSSIWSW